MSVVITKIQLGEALTDMALALATAMPDMVEAINQNDPSIASKRTAEIGKYLESKKSPWAALFMAAFTDAITDTWVFPNKV